MSSKTPLAFGFVQEGTGEVDSGMTLRDYFAAATAGHMVTHVMLGSPEAIKAFAARCYEIADALLVAREKK